MREGFLVLLSDHAAAWIVKSGAAVSKQHNRACAGLEAAAESVVDLLYKSLSTFRPAARESVRKQIDMQLATS